MGGPDVQHRGGQSIFLHTLMDIFFFLQGPRPPQGTTWLRPCHLVKLHKQIPNSCLLFIGILFCAEMVGVWVWLRYFGKGSV